MLTKEGVKVGRKQSKQVAYIHERTVIACEQSANGKGKKTISRDAHMQMHAQIAFMNHESYHMVSFR
jgi:hypothetical protein